MADPWEIPPIPDRGDVSAKDTHVARSRALDAWESLEVALSMLDMLFARTLGIRAKYGSGQIFVKRLDILEKGANDYFIKYPNQDKEAAFGVLVCQLRRYSQRRHDIAHGIVQPLGINDNIGVEFGVLPAGYTIDRKGHCFPKFIYNAEIIAALENRFIDLWRQTMDFMSRLSSSEP
jgi:hypothetical protein